MSTKQLRILIVSLAMVAGATATWAQGPPCPGMPPGPPSAPGLHGGHHPHGPMMGPAGRILREIDLDSAQREQIREIIHDGVEGESMRAFRDARHALALRIWDATATEADLLEASARVAEQAQALDSDRRRLALEVMAVLTEEQQAAFRERLAERPEAPQSRRGPRGMRRGPGPGSVR